MMDIIQNGFIYPSWNVPDTIRMVITTRQNGFSKPPYESLNLSMHVGDDSAAVEKNRQYVYDTLQLPSEPFWLEQQHGNKVSVISDPSPITTADSAVALSSNKVCAVMVADCLPVFLCDKNAKGVAVAHCGWRGLATDVLQNTMTALNSAPKDIYAWLGPAIGTNAFQVGDDVRNAFINEDDAYALSFLPDNQGKWMADIYQIARIQLQRLGIERIEGGFYCTYYDKRQFYSYRRDAVTGRIAALAWIDDKSE